MEIAYSQTLEINKLSQSQFNTAKTAGTLDANALYLTPEQPVTFTSSGGASAGATYDGSAAVTVSYATVGAASSGHTHTSKITASSATSAGTATSISLSHGSSYKLWTGSASAFTFTMPSTPTHTCSIASETSTASSLTLAHGSRYKLTAGGNSFVFTMPSVGTVVSQTSLSTSSTNDYYILASNTTSPTSGSAYGSYYTSYVKLRGTGQLTAQTFYAASDKRLKENIVAYTPPKSVLDLPIYTYNYISDESKTQHIGCLAQDLQEICPELVSLDGEYLTINESKIVYLLLDEVKKLKAEVEDLKAKV